MIHTVALIVAAALDGNAILAQAAASPGLQSYTVPVHFDVHMHRPIGVKAGVEGVVYYKSPASTALSITRVPGILGHFFSGTYTLDIAPQTWPANYTVVSVSQAESENVPVYVLTAVAKHDPSLKQVVFKVTQATDEPVAVTWTQTDGSSISVTMINEAVNGVKLPATEDITVSQPKYSLDATATYGSYKINAPIPSGVFKR